MIIILEIFSPARHGLWLSFICNNFFAPNGRIKYKPFKNSMQMNHFISMDHSDFNTHILTRTARKINSPPFSQRGDIGWFPHFLSPQSFISSSLGDFVVTLPASFPPPFVSRYPRSRARSYKYAPRPYSFPRTSSRDYRSAP